MIPERQTYSTSCMVSRRPAMTSVHPRFYRCGQCKSITIEYGEGFFSESESESESKCGCGGMRRFLKPADADKGDGIHSLTWVFFGGAEHNAVRVLAGGGSHPMTKEHHIQWIYLRTYEGGQLKYIHGSQKAQALFALAGNDAYSYCNRPICRMGREHCQFQCKRGWEIYAYCSLHGLYHLGL